MLLNSHISAYATCFAQKVCSLVRSTWGTALGGDKLGARDRTLSTKVARRACAGQTLPHGVVSQMEMLRTMCGHRPGGAPGATGSDFGPSGEGGHTCKSHLDPLPFGSQGQWGNVSAPGACRASFVTHAPPVDPCR